MSFSTRNRYAERQAAVSSDLPRGAAMIRTRSVDVRTVKLPSAFRVTLFDAEFAQGQLRQLLVRLLFLVERLLQQLDGFLVTQ